MQKIYVLLRQDKQTGPYSLEEIIQFDLKPYDLIWIEGNSAGWYYPQEIKALHPYLSFLPKPTKPAVAANERKTVFVAPPVVNQPLVSPSVTSPEPVSIAPAETNVSFRPASENIEEKVYAQFRQPVAAAEPVMTRATSGQNKKPAFSPGVAIATVLVIGGVFAASWIMNWRGNENNTTSESTAETPVQSEIPGLIVPDNNSRQTTSSTVTKQKKPEKNTTQKQATFTSQQNPAVRQASRKVTVMPAHESTDYSANDLPQQQEPVVIQEEQQTNPPAETTAPQEKKKKLRDKILDLFRKKTDEPKEVESRPVENENGERIATRRESSANLVQLVQVRFDVPNDWMMGIKAAKATLLNRSSQKISQASVEVLYYNDENELLQKKVVNFSKIDAKESKTIAIPDHPMATKVDYNVLSVTGAGQPPA